MVGITSSSASTIQRKDVTCLHDARVIRWAHTTKYGNWPIPAAKRPSPIRAASFKPWAASGFSLHITVGKVGKAERQACCRSLGEKDGRSSERSCLMGWVRWFGVDVNRG